MFVQAMAKQENRSVLSILSFVVIVILSLLLELVMLAPLYDSAFFRNYLQVSQQTIDDYSQNIIFFSLCVQVAFAFLIMITYQLHERRKDILDVAKMIDNSRNSIDQITSSISQVFSDRDGFSTVRLFPTDDERNSFRNYCRASDRERGISYNNVYFVVSGPNSIGKDEIETIAAFLGDNRPPYISIFSNSNADEIKTSISKSLNKKLLAKSIDRLKVYRSQMTSSKEFTLFGDHIFSEITSAGGAQTRGVSYYFSNEAISRSYKLALVAERSRAIEVFNP